MIEEETILKDILKKLKDFSVNGSKEVENFLIDCAQSGTFLQTCLNVLQMNRIPLNVRQQTASIIAKILFDHSDLLSPNQQANLVQRLMANWNIVSDVKKMFVKSITHLLVIGEETFQATIKSLLDRVMETLQNLHRQQMSDSNIQGNCYGNMVYRSKFKKTSNFFAEISQTILMLSTCLLQSICQSGDDYLSQLMQKIKIFHSILFDYSNLHTDHTIFLKLFNFYEDLVGLAFQNKQYFMHQIKEIVTWPFILDNLVSIYKFDIISINQTSPINLLVSTNQQFLQVKILAAEFHKQLLNIHLETIRLGRHHSTPIISAPFIQSLHFTVQYMAEHLSIMSDQLCKYSLTLFSLYGSCISLSNINFQQGLDIIHAVLIPIMDFFVCKNRQMFQDDVTQFYKEIQDCCQLQSMETFLSESAKTLQIIIDKCPQIYQFLFQQCQKSFNYILTSDYDQTIRSQIPISTYHIKICTNLFLSAFLWHNQLKNDEFQQVFKIIAIPQFFIKLDDYEKALLYYNLENSWHDYFENLLEYGQFFFLQSLNTNLHQSTRQFALYFVAQNCDLHFYQSFIRQFFSTFNFTERNQQQWMILHKIIQTYYEEFNQTCICQLMQTIQLHIQQGIRYCQTEIENRKNIDCSIINSYILICDIICKLYIRDRNKHQIRKEIFKFFKMINELKPINLDDNIIRIANHIFGQGNQLVQQFTDYLPYVNRNFMQNNYEGKYIMCQQQYQNCIQPIAIILLMGINQHTSNLQINVSDDSLLTINNSLILLQNLCILHGKTIHEKTTQQILMTCEQINTMICQSKKQNIRTILMGRTMNLEIICRFTVNLEVPFSKIIQNSRQGILIDYDARLLMYLLQKTISLNPNRLENCDHIITVILYLLRSAVSKSFHFKNLQKSMNQKRYNNILDRIKNVVDNDKPLACYAAIILERYNFYDWNYVKSIHPTIKVTDYKFILHNLQEATSLSLSTLSLQKKEKSKSIIEIVSTRTILRVKDIKKSIGINELQGTEKTNIWALTNTTSSERQPSYDKKWKRKGERYEQIHDYRCKPYTM